MTTTSTPTLESIKELLRTSDRAVYRAMEVLTARQTSAEQRSHETVERNGRGWNGWDAAIMTSLTEYYRSHGRLTPGQMRIARKKLPKYAGQLLEEALARQAERASGGESLRTEAERIAERQAVAQMNATYPEATAAAEAEDAEPTLVHSLAEHPDIYWSNRAAALEREQEERAAMSDPMFRTDEFACPEA